MVKLVIQDILVETERFYTEEDLPCPPDESELLEFSDLFFD